MSVLAVFRWEGDPDALLAAYDRELQHAVPSEQPASHDPHLRPRGRRCASGQVVDCEHGPLR
jgi:hypothetical protein